MNIDGTLFNMYMTIPYILLFLFSLHIFSYVFNTLNIISKIGQVEIKNVNPFIGVLAIVALLVIIALLFYMIHQIYYGTSHSRYNLFIVFVVIYFFMLLFSGFSILFNLNDYTTKPLLFFLREGMYRPKLSNTSSIKIGQIFKNYIIYMILGYTFITMYNYHVFKLASNGSDNMKPMINFVQFNFGMIFFIYLMSFVKTFRLFNDYDNISNKKTLAIFFYLVIAICYGFILLTSCYFHDIFNISKWGVITALLIVFGIIIGLFGIIIILMLLERIYYDISRNNFLGLCGFAIITLIITYTGTLGEMMTNSKYFASMILVNLGVLSFIGLFVFLISKANPIIKQTEKLLGTRSNDTWIKYVNYFIILAIAVIVWVFYLNVFSIKIKKNAGHVS